MKNEKIKNEKIKDNIFVEKKAFTDKFQITDLNEKPGR